MPTHTKAITLPEAITEAIKKLVVSNPCKAPMEKIPIGLQANVLFLMRMAYAQGRRDAIDSKESH